MLYTGKSGRTYWSVTTDAVTEKELDRFILHMRGMLTEKTDVVTLDIFSVKTMPEKAVPQRMVEFLETHAKQMGRLKAHATVIQGPALLSVPARLVGSAIRMKSGKALPYQEEVFMSPSKALGWLSTFVTIDKARVISDILIVAPPGSVPEWEP